MPTSRFLGFLVFFSLFGFLGIGFFRLSFFDKAGASTLEEHFAGDKVEDHTTGGSKDFGDHRVPTERDKKGKQSFIEGEEGDAVEDSEFDEEAAARFFVRSIEDPSNAGPEVEDG